MTLGERLRAWRARRGSSQMALALAADVSPRHLSFVETGRSKASVDLVLQLAKALNLGLRDCNELLLAAGFAPRFPETAFDADAMTSVRAAVQRLLGAHEPYPGVALDRYWNVVHGNRAATRMLALLPESLKVPRVNMIRAALHPEGFAAMTENLEAWAGHLVEALERLADASLDPGLAALRDEVRGYPNLRPLNLRQETPQAQPRGHALVLPCVMHIGGQRLSLISTKLAFSTALDVTLSELVVELFYPNDEATEKVMRHGA